MSVFLHIFPHVPATFWMRAAASGGRKEAELSSGSNDVSASRCVFGSRLSKAAKSARDKDENVNYLEF